MSNTWSRSSLGSLTLLTALTVAAAAPATAAQESYSYIRGLEGGDAVLYSASADQSGRAAGGDRLELNTPILTGDRLAVGRGSRVDVGLADRNLLRVASGADLYFEQLAASGDNAARSTLLRLDAGEVQLVVVDDAAGEEYPRVDTPNATIYVESPGSYSIMTEGVWSSITVRQGSAEVVTRLGGSTVRAGEQLRVDGDESPRVNLVSAGGLSTLERWGRSLDAEVATANYGYVDRSLRYEAAPLYRHGSWFSVGGRYGWRPGVSIAWRPYTDGRWMYTPSGLTWVSNEPWGWATSHYGGWDYVPGYGWTWFPGTTYAPAWVYWHWSDNYVGWCPTAYYTRYYNNDYGNRRFRWGVHGWARGDWNDYANWTFCPNRDFGRRDVRNYCLPGSQARQRFRLDAVPNGILTTDTRAITPDRWTKPLEIVGALDRRARDTRPGGGILPDVSDFVARRRDLPPQVADTVIGKEPAGAGRSGRGRGETQWVDVNDEVVGRLGTNVLTPGHTNEKPIRLATPRGESYDPDQNRTTREAVPSKPDRADRSHRGDDGERAAPEAKPSSGDWRSARPAVGNAAPRTREPNNSGPAAPAGDWRTKPSQPNTPAPGATTREKPRPSSPAIEKPAPRDESWRDQSGGREGSAKPVARPSAPTTSAPTVRSEDWRRGGSDKPVPTARPEAKPRADDNPYRSWTDRPAARPTEEPSAKPAARDDWRTRGNAGDESPTRLRIPAERPAAAAKDPAESPAVRRVMDRIGVGMGRGPQPTTQPNPAVTPPSPRTYSAPERTAKPEVRTPPPSRDRGGDSSASGDSSARGSRSNDRGGDGGSKDRSAKDRKPPPR